MVVLSSCWRIARRQALKRPSERTLGLSSEGGNTGRRADWPCHTKITNDLLRPSVQLPAGSADGALIRILAGFARLEAVLSAPDGSGAGSGTGPRGPYQLDLFVCIAYK